MPKKTIKGLEIALADEQRRHREACARELSTNKRLEQIVAENESLRKDKSWLQSMLSNVMQSVVARKL